MQFSSHRRAVTIAAQASAGHAARTAWALSILLGLGGLSHAQQSSRQNAAVDATPPQLSLEVREQTAARVLVAFRATDPHLDAASLKCLGWFEGASGSRVATAPTETRTTLVNGGIEGSMIWS